MMKQVTLAVIGAGQRGQMAYAPYAVSHPHKAKFIAAVEPDKEKRESFKKTHNLGDDMLFADEDTFFNAKIKCDAILICTQDKQHYKTAIRAMEAGYHILLEKPMSPSAKECVELGECAEKTGRIMLVCHVLRYTKFFMKIKEILDSGVIGNLVTITHNENVGFFHQAHSFVRGNWRNTEESAPMILAKSCHDMDVLLWLSGGNCTRVSSFGGLAHFKESEAPEGSTDRCVNGCEVEGNCPYSALKIYLHSGRRGWPTSVITHDPTDENIMAALREGPYGRCVYRCDNDVVDHQTVNIEFDNGVTALFNMSAFTNETSRTIKLMGSLGEIRGHMEDGSIKVYDFATGDVTEYDQAPAITGHSGGDLGIMETFVELIANDKPNDDGKTSFKASVQSHLMALASEDSRLTGKTVEIKNFKESCR